MTRLFLIAAGIIFIMPTPLIIFAALFNWQVIRKKPLKQNLRELGRAILSAGISMFITIITRPFNFLDKLPLLKKNQDARPILMVHGLYHNRTAWLFMKHRLNRQGFSNLNTWQYNSFTTSYPELVLELRKQIAKLYEENNCRVMLVGHSLGGLIICGAAAEPDIENKVSGIITLGTPFKGSILTLVAPGRLGRSLHPESSLFKGEKKIISPENTKKTAVISPTDEMVQPWSNLSPDPKKWEIIQCPALGHVAMLYSSSVATIVAENIKKIRG